ncbi:MAG: amidohydrolase family protein [Verrucomicrobiota bacterium]
MTTPRPLSRREFLVGSTLLLASAASNLHSAEVSDASPSERVIDIHQHTNYGGRSDDQLFAHQRAMGVTTTILLPAGRPVVSASTHEGVSNGLQAKCTGNDAVMKFAQEHPKEFLFGANEVPDLPDAITEIEKYLKLGAAIIAESKFGVECDSPEMQKIYALAQEYKVPMLMHWQFQMYNYGFERFHTMLKKFPKVNFIGHAQTWWANIDKDHKDQAVLYPKTKVTPGGLTDRYLSDFPNMFGDLSAGSGLNSLVRDEDHTRAFLERHQDKLLYGSDCVDTIGRGPGCQGAQTIAAIRRLSPSKKIERKLLYENAKKMFQL